jgi:hypothetical protein
MKRLYQLHDFSTAKYIKSIVLESLVETGHFIQTKETLYEVMQIAHVLSPSNFEDITQLFVTEKLI